MITTVNEIKCNHFFCVGKSVYLRPEATRSVFFAGSKAVLPHETACCARCFEAYRPLIERTPQDYTVTEL